MTSQSTTLVEAQQAMFDRLRTAWIADPVTAALPFETSVTFENATFVPPDDTAWARGSIRISSSTQETFGAPGGRRFARAGQFFVQIFVPKDAGTTLANQIAQVVMGAFEGVTNIPNTTLYFTDVIPRNIGPSFQWHQLNVEVQFTFFERK